MVSVYSECSGFVSEFEHLYVVTWSDIKLVHNYTGMHYQWASSFTRFLDHIHRHTTVGRTPLGEWSARRIDLYLTTHNTHSRQASTWQHTTLTTHRPLMNNTQQSQHTELYLKTLHTHNTRTSTWQHKTLTTHGPVPDNTQHSQNTDLYLTTHNTHNRQTSIPPDGIEATISAGDTNIIISHWTCQHKNIPLFTVSFILNSKFPAIYFVSKSKLCEMVIGNRYINK